MTRIDWDHAPGATWGCDSRAASWRLGDRAQPLTRSKTNRREWSRSGSAGTSVFVGHAAAVGLAGAVSRA